MADRETIIETGDGGAAAIVAGLVIVAIIVVGLFFFFGVNRNSHSVTLEVPKVTVDVAPNGQ